MASRLHADRSGCHGLAGDECLPATAHAYASQIFRRGNHWADSYIVFLAVAVAFPVPPAYHSPPELYDCFRYNSIPSAIGGHAGNIDIRGTADSTAGLCYPADYRRTTQAVGDAR